MLTFQQNCQSVLRCPMMLHYLQCYDSLRCCSWRAICWKNFVLCVLNLFIILSNIEIHMPNHIVALLVAATCNRFSIQKTGMDGKLLLCCFRIHTLMFSFQVVKKKKNPTSFNKLITSLPVLLSRWFLVMLKNEIHQTFWLQIDAWSTMQNCNTFLYLAIILGDL